GSWPARGSSCRRCSSSAPSRWPFRRSTPRRADETTMTPGLALSQRAFDPLIAGSLALFGAFYAAGIARMWRSAGRGHGIRGWEALCFGLGWLSLAAALQSPVAVLAELLFSVHMTQHEVLMLVAAPLIVLGRPLTALLWALPPS